MEWMNANFEEIKGKIASKKELSADENLVVAKVFGFAEIVLKSLGDDLIDARSVLAEDMKELGPAVGSRLKQLRIAKNLNQEDLEKKSGVSQGTISKIENGYRMVTPDEAKRLAKHLDSTPQFIIAGKK